MEKAQWMGGPMVLPIHTHVFAKEEGLRSLDSLLNALKTKDVAFSSAARFLEWFKMKSSITLDVEMKSARKMIVKLKNPINISVHDLPLFFFLENWKVESGPFNLVPPLADGTTETAKLKIDELKAGQELTWIFVQ
jgi:hypothetical protein